jgi:hypothetical protein
MRLIKQHTVKNEVIAACILNPHRKRDGFEGLEAVESQRLLSSYAYMPPPQPILLGRKLQMELRRKYIKCYDQKSNRFEEIIILY